MDTWRLIQRNNFTKLKDLLSFLEMDESPDFLKKSSFPLNVPFRLAQKMEKKNPEDPLFLQFVPFQEEEKKQAGFVENPTEDPSFLKTPKLLQKYEKRALLITTSACAMHCRYCFRKNFPYEKESDFSEELKVIREDTSLFEVILSGGDPLSLSSSSLHFLLQELDKIPHIQIIRFHTRFLIGIPERIDSSFLRLLSSLQKKLVFVIHVNHPKEIDRDVEKAIFELRKIPASILCQSVLLKGVNDNIETLVELSETLLKTGVIPYYLHKLDPVLGSHQFEVDLKKSLSLVKKLQEKVPGYGLFRFVQEIPGAKSKTDLHSINHFNSQ